MLNSVFATKLGMTQAWTTAGKRMAVTRCKIDTMSVVGHQPSTNADQAILEIGYGPKKLKNIAKPLRSRLEKSGFSFGVKEVRGLRINVAEGETVPAIGSTVELGEILTVGDVVKVQGVTKGRGFAGAMKRHGFHGSQRTHGQSDRERAVGSIGSGTTPGRVLKGKRMAGHYGTETMTISGLVVLHIDPQTQEIWLSGPVPGFATSTMTIRKTGEKRDVELDFKASGIEVAAEPEAAEEAQTEVVEEVAVEAKTTKAPEEIKEEAKEEATA